MTASITPERQSSKTDQPQKFLSRFVSDMPPWEDSNFDVPEPRSRLARAGRRAGATTSAGPKEKIILPERQCGLRQCRKIRDWRMFKEMNFHFSHQSSNPTWSATQSVSNCETEGGQCRGGFSASSADGWRAGQGLGSPGPSKKHCAYSANGRIQVASFEKPATVTR